METTLQITINGESYEMPRGELTAADIRRASQAEGPVYIDQGTVRRLIVDGERLTIVGGERFITVPEKAIVGPAHTTTITIEVDGHRYRTSAHALTGAEIKALAHKPPASILYRLEHGQRVEVGNGELVHLHDGEKFITQPNIGGAG